MDFHNRFADIMNSIFGGSEKFSLEQRCITGICFFAAMSMSLGLFVNIAMSMPVETVVVVFGFGILFSFLYYRSRYKGGSEFLFWPLFVSGCLFCILIWKYNGGLSGSPTIIALIAVVIIAIIAKGKQSIFTSSLILLLMAFLLIIEYHYPELVMEYSSRRNKFIDNFFTFSIAVIIVVSVINFIMNEYQAERRKVKDSYEKLKEQSDALRVSNKKLSVALLEVKQLSGLLPICSGCKKVRDDRGYWNQIESYIEKHSNVSLSHSLCPECADKMYGEEEWYQTTSQKQGDSDIDT